MDELDKEEHIIQLHVNLPETRMHRHESRTSNGNIKLLNAHRSTTRLIQIPESLIAQQLRNSLETIHGQKLQNDHDQHQHAYDDESSYHIPLQPPNNHNNDDEKDNIVLQSHGGDTILTTECNLVIKAFRCLYTKYVDSDNAPFMINISGQLRKKLTHLFDKNLYRNQINGGSLSLSRNRMPRISIVMSILGIQRSSSRKARFSKTHSLSVNSSYPKSENETKTTPFLQNVRRKYGKQQSMKSDKEISFVNKELSGFLQQYEQRQISDVQILKSFFKLILTPYERCASEISFLINDSFSRFIVNDNNCSLYDRLCSQADN